MFSRDQLKRAASLTEEDFAMLVGLLMADLGSEKTPTYQFSGQRPN
jgi:hypothetical protein